MKQIPKTKPNPPLYNRYIYMLAPPPRSIWEAFSLQTSQILGILVLEVALLHINSFKNPIENQTEILETWNPGILVLDVVLVYIHSP